MNQDTLDQLVEVQYRSIIEAESDPQRIDASLIFYFDAYDVRRTMMGIEDYYSHGRFQSSQYFSTNTTLYSLLIDRWFEEVRLLPTHQTELLDFIRRASGNAPFTVQSIEAFASDVLSVREIRIPNGLSVGEVIKQRVLESQDQYNFCQTVAYGDWRRRLKRLHDGPLKFSSYDMREVSTLPNRHPTIFYPLLKAFHKLRSHVEYAMSNFKDAIALTHLYESKTANPKHLPILLDSGKMFSRVIESAQLRNHFEYFNESLGRNVSLVRSPEYFILKALFDTPKEKLNKLKERYEEIYVTENSERNVYSWRVHLENQKLSDGASDDLITTVELRIDNYRKYFNEYLRHRFFQRIGLTAGLDEMLSKAVERYLSASPVILEEAQIQQYIKSFKKSYNHALIDSDRFEVLTRAWNSLSNHRPQWWPMRAKLSEVDEDFVQVHFGLLRFGLDGMIRTSEARTRYANCLDAIFHDQKDHHDRQREITARVVLNLTDALFRNDAESLAIAISALWVLDMHAFISEFVDLFDRDAIGNRNGIDLVQAASLVQSSLAPPKVKRVTALLDEMNSGGRRLNDIDRLGCAYVNYLVWDKLSYSKTFSKSLTHPKGSTNEYYLNARKHIDRCISYFQSKILEWEKTHRIEDIGEYSNLIRLKLYALNVKLFLVVEGEPSEKDFNQQERLITELVASKPANQSAWQARYDDTIARYKLRKAFYAFSNGDIKGYKALLNAAHKYARAAKKASFQDVAMKESLCNSIATIKKQTIEDLKLHLNGEKPLIGFL